MRYFSVMMTRDATQSAQVLVEASDHTDAYEKAKGKVTERDWILDDGNSRDRNDIYLGDPTNSIEEISVEEFVRQNQPLPALATEAVISALKDLLAEVESFVDMGIPFEYPENGFHDVVMKARAIIAQSTT